MPALSPTKQKSRTAVKSRRAPTVTLFTAVSIVISNMVGTGIFTSLGYQVDALPSGFVILVLWTLGGVCAICGALAYAELAAALPRSGGEYHFLSEAYHPAAGFLAGWISATVGFSAPTALAAMSFGIYAHEAAPQLPELPLSLAVVLICTAIHFTGSKRGGAFQNVFTVLKVALIAAFIVAGLFSPHPQAISFAPRPGDWKLITSSAFAISLFYVMYSYSGWNASTYIVGEIKEPQKNVPRSVIIGSGSVLLMYAAMNAVFLHTTPMSDMVRKPNVGALAASHLFGPKGASLMDALICLGLVSTVSSMMWIGPRVTVAMGEDLPGLRLLGKTTRSGIRV